MASCQLLLHADRWSVHMQSCICSRRGCLPLPSCALRDRCRPSACGWQPTSCPCQACLCKMSTKSHTEVKPSAPQCQMPCGLLTYCLQPAAAPPRPHWQLHCRCPPSFPALPCPRPSRPESGCAPAQQGSRWCIDARPVVRRSGGQG